MGISYRQIHLDFHTSELIEGIGSEFTKEHFQKMLQLGHVSSINIFAKCHHGWAYHDAKANERHPNLQFDLLKEMIDACHEIGVKCPIYISAGLDEKMARRHPEWLFRNKDESTTWAKNFFEPGYHEFCMNSPYLDYLKDQVVEIVSNYDADGVWLDIVGERVCYCQNCIRTARAKGIDPRDEDAMRALGRETFRKYYTTINDAIHAVKPDLPVFHNSGHVTRGRKDLESILSHIEIESLPTGGWGYDDFPLSARYVQNSGKEYLGMTGKFHTTWGEFGGFKHPNALRYETSLCLAMGAKCSIGDQLHPLGKLDETTYTLIGEAYSEVEQKEKYCDDRHNLAEIAFVSTEAAASSGLSDVSIADGKNSDLGALRILQEGQYLFDVIDEKMDFDRYKIVLFPDVIRFDAALAEKVRAYTAKGGRVILTGKSGLAVDADRFAVDTGAEYLNPGSYNPTYCRPSFDLKNLKSSAYIMYEPVQELKVAEDTEVLAECENPYFNRDVFTFSSHYHTPNDYHHRTPAIIRKGNIVYCGWNFFKLYSTKSELAYKQIMHHLVDLLLDHDRAVRTSLPVPGIVTLFGGNQDKTELLHLLYASPIKRGEVEVIEDIPDLYHTAVTLKTEGSIRRVSKVPQNEEIPFTMEDGRLSFTVDRFNCHQMILIEKE